MGEALHSVSTCTVDRCILKCGRSMNCLPHPGQKHPSSPGTVFDVAGHSRHVGWRCQCFIVWSTGQMRHLRTWRSHIAHVRSVTQMCGKLPCRPVILFFFRSSFLVICRRLSTKCCSKSSRICAAVVAAMLNCTGPDIYWDVLLSNGA